MLSLSHELREKLDSTTCVTARVTHLREESQPYVIATSSMAMQLQLYAFPSLSRLSIASALFLAFFSLRFGP